MTNMLGMQLQEINTSDNIDQPMSPIEKQQAWRMAMFHPFNLRYKRQLDIWLSPIDTDESELSQMELPCTLTTKSLQTDNDMLIRCTKNIEHSFQEINSKATPDQTRIIFESLSKLQNDIQNNHAISKRSHASQELTDTKDKNEDEFTSPK